MEHSSKGVFLEEFLSGIIFVEVGNIGFCVEASRLNGQVKHTFERGDLAVDLGRRVAIFILLEEKSSTLTSDNKRLHDRASGLPQLN
jgi:hypothetical protein